MLWRAARRMTPGIRILGAVTERGARLDGERRLLQVSDVLRAIEDQFHTAFPAPDLGLRHAARPAHRHADIESPDGRAVDAFVLVEETDEGMRTLPCELLPEARLAIDDTLRRLHDVAVDDLLVDGHYVRAGGLLSYDPQRHCAIFEVTALDPQPTAAWLAERREQVRSAASSARLAERQRDLRVPTAPSSIALVAASGDPGARGVPGAARRLRLRGRGQGLRPDDRRLSGRRPARERAARGGARRPRPGAAAAPGRTAAEPGAVRLRGRRTRRRHLDHSGASPGWARPTSPPPSRRSPTRPTRPRTRPRSRSSAGCSAPTTWSRTPCSRSSTPRDEAMRRAARRLEQVRHRLAEDIRQATARTMEHPGAQRLLRIRLLAARHALADRRRGRRRHADLADPRRPGVPLGIALAAPRLRTRGGGR